MTDAPRPTPGQIRPVRADDLDGLAAVIAATGLFPPELLEPMVARHLAGEEDAFWLTEDAGGPRAVAYCAPERMTSGTWNLLLIAVEPARQGQGRGSALVAAVEAGLTGRGAHLLLVETSDLAEFAGTRAFYAARGFAETARIPDFYRPGEGKVVFLKRLAAAGAGP